MTKPMSKPMSKPRMELLAFSLVSSGKNYTFWPLTTVWLYSHLLSTKYSDSYGPYTSLRPEEF